MCNKALRKVLLHEGNTMHVEQASTHTKRSHRNKVAILKAVMIDLLDKFLLRNRCVPGGHEACLKRNHCRWLGNNDFACNHINSG